jgi:ABC-2 type transport system permease protein
VIDLVYAELLKFRTTRAFYAYPAIVVLLVGLGVSGDIGSAADTVREDPDYQRNLVEGAGFGAVLAAIVGITIVTTELRHGTITPTLLNTPRRELVVIAKAIAAVIIAAGLALLALLTLFVAASIWLAAVGADNLLTRSESLELAAQVFLSGPLWALVGVAVGALVQSQVAALVGTLIWIFIGETILLSVLGLLDLDGVADYLPFQALDAADGTGFELLPYWTAVGVSLAWAAALGALGTERLRRRDIT